VAVELVAGLAGALSIVFAEDVGADVQAKADKSNTTQYYIYDYQGNRVRTVVESNNQTQSQRKYLPLLDLPM
jgi:hypothetical protein